MPRTRRGAAAARVGVRVPGIYADLLLREREGVGRADAAAADRAERGLRCRRSRHLLDALEAGEPVVVSASQLVSRRVPVPEHMRPGRRAGVRWWRVTPDDAVEQASSPVVDRPTRKRRGEGMLG
jgi:antitoxin (DNA-binding transcriptional repressor) of toxin-antitoxin stability system